VCDAGPGFMSFASSAVSSAHADGVDSPGVQVQWESWGTATPSLLNTSVRFRLELYLGGRVAEILLIS